MLKKGNIYSVVRFNQFQDKSEINTSFIYMSCLFFFNSHISVTMSCLIEVQLHNTIVIPIT